MIRSIRSPGTEALFQRDPLAPFPPEIRLVGLRKLAILNSAIRLSDLLAVPDNHVETLRGGSHKGFHRLHLEGDWYLYFWWMDGDAYKVAIERKAAPHG